MRKGMDFRLSRGYEMYKDWKSLAQWLLARSAREVNGKLTFNHYKEVFCRKTNDKIRNRAEKEISKYLSSVGDTTEEDIHCGDLIKIDNVAESLGLTKVVLKKIGERRRGVTTRRNWQKSTYLRKGEVVWLQSCIDECISCKDAGHCLGISDRHQMQALYDNHVFPHADPDLLLDHRSRCFSRAAINEFCHGILLLPDRSCIDLGTEMEWRTAKSAFMSRHNSSLNFYRVVVTGHLAPVGRLATSRGFPCLIFRRPDVLKISQDPGIATIRSPDVDLATGKHQPRLH